jgi:hypothetical protein
MRVGLVNRQPGQLALIELQHLRAESFLKGARIPDPMTARSPLKQHRRSRMILFFSSSSLAKSIKVKQHCFVFLRHCSRKVQISGPDQGLQ